jgi:chromosome segregation ATPase
VLLLRDREANLRRRLMEHWSGVMAWEVRRLERTSSETYSRLERANKRAATSKAREEDMSRKVQDLEAELSRRAERTTELEEMVVEMGRRERAIEEEVRELDVVKKRLQDENAAKDREIEQVRSGQGSREEDMRSFEQERQNWLAEKRMLIQDREAVVRARAADRANGQMSEKDREMVERVRLGLAGLLGRKAVVGDAELPDAVEEVKKVLSARENEVVRLKEELREVNVGLEEEIRRISADRDLWKGKAEDVQRSGSSRENDVAALEKKLRVGQRSVSLGVRS